VVIDTHEQKKQAFKLGFCLKLAEVKISPSQLAELAEKVAKKDGSRGGFSIPGASIPGVIATTGLASGGLALGLPMITGSVVGATANKLLDQDIDTLSQARKRYLIKKLRQMIRERGLRQDNKMIGEAMRA